MYYTQFLTLILKFLCVEKFNTKTTPDFYSLNLDSNGLFGILHHSVKYVVQCSTLWYDTNYITLRYF